MSMVKRKRFLRGLAICAAIGAAFSLAFYFHLLYSLQQQSSDFLFRAAELRTETSPDEQIIVVGIDDDSLAQLGHISSWPRSHYASLIDRLNADGARVIALDILFAEATEGDAEMAAAMRNASNVVLPFVYTLEDPYIIAEPAGRGSATVQPLTGLAEAAAAVGYANVSPDADGIVRSMIIATGDDDGYRPALALAAAATYLRRPEAIEAPVADGRLPFAGRLIPVGDKNEMLINYIGSPQGNGGTASFQYVSFVDALNGKLPPGTFQDKLVIIGATAEGLGDIFWTPMGRVLNGVEIHASAIHTILSANFLKPVPAAATVGLILVLTLISGLAVLRLRTLWSSLAGLFLYAIYFLAAFSLFDNGILLNMLYPPIAIAGTFAGLNLYSVTSERSEKRHITNTFGRYISPSVVDKILAASEEGELRLGGEEHEVTVVFADVRGFTGIAEKTPPGVLVEALNAHLSLIIKAVLEHDGIINKFGGDSLMAIWNVPLERPEHALSAVKAALSAQRAISGLQQRTKLPRLDFGIGVNTGKALAGTMGSADRLEYSVIGDAVNTAARLADAAPGGRIWI
ncbi:MAG: adenylate/guanylate cyclase domain-containing protein, partial [Chloroflexota bacterium]